MIKKTLRFTLIEVMIATSLFGILMFFSSSLFFRYQKLCYRLEEIRPLVFQRALFYEKMLEITSSIDLSSIKKSSPYHSEYLSFIFDNGFKDNASFSGKILCEIYRTFDKELIYKLTSDDGKEIKRPLLSSINSFSYSLEKKILSISLKDTDSNQLNYTFCL
jgi:prepilin-type N-terminal cleavage/methylation domain-containing protein